MRRRQVGVTAIEFGPRWRPYGSYGPYYGGYRPDYYGGYRPESYAYRPNTYGGHRPLTPEQVAIVQGKLGVPVTGVMDGQTMESVRSFQSSRGLAPTGVVDPGTWQLIAMLPQGFGAGVVMSPYGSYDPYQAPYAGYPTGMWLGTFSNPSRGGSGGSGGGGR